MTREPREIGLSATPPRAAAIEHEAQRLLDLAVALEKEVMTLHQQLLGPTPPEAYAEGPETTQMRMGFFDHVERTQRRSIQILETVLNAAMVMNSEVFGVQTSDAGMDNQRGAGHEQEAVYRKTF